MVNKIISRIGNALKNLYLINIGNGNSSERVYKLVNRIGTTFVLGSLLACSTLSTPEGRTSMTSARYITEGTEAVSDQNREYQIPQEARESEDF